MKALYRQVGQLLVAGFAGHSVPSELRALAKEWGLGGAVLFSRNIVEPEQVAELTFELQGLSKDVPLWVGVDQEGGRVARLRAPFTEWPAMALLGRRGDIGLTKRFAKALADELSAASELVTGKALNIPAVLIRGAKVSFAEKPDHSLIRPLENDMFR